MPPDTEGFAAGRAAAHPDPPFDVRLDESWEPSPAASPDPPDGPIPGPDPGACPRCGEWRKAGMIHRCPAATPDQNWADEDAVLAAGAAARTAEIVEWLRTTKGDEWMRGQDAARSVVSRFGGGES